MTEKFWDKTAEKYSKAKIADESNYKKKLAETQSFLQPDMRVLEFGCGTGTTAIHHAPHVQTIDAIDISENMIQIGRCKAKKAGVNNIKFTHSTLAGFNAPNASFDVILGLNIIHLLPDWKDAIAEIARILKPGGLFISSTVCLGDSYLRFIKIVAPLGKMLGILPDLVVFKELELVKEITGLGLKIERKWNHGKSLSRSVIVAQKVKSDSA